MKTRKKNVVKMLSICLAFLLAAGSILTVFAGEDGKKEKNTDGLTVYLDTAKGDDDNDGLTKETPLKTWNAVKKHFEQAEEEKQDEETSGNAEASADEKAEEEKIAVLCGKTVLSDAQKKTLTDDGITVMTETEYTEYLKEKEEMPVPSPVPAPDGDEKEDAAVTPTPTPGGDEKEDAAATPTPAPGGDEKEDAAATPTPTPGGDEKEDAAVTPTPAPGENEKEDENVAVTPTPAPGDEEKNDAEAAVTPAPGEEEMDGISPLEEQAVNGLQMLFLLPGDGGDEQNGDGPTGDGIASEEQQTADVSEENRLLAAAESSRTVTRTEAQETRKLPGTDLVGGGTSSAGPTGGSSGSSSAGSSRPTGTGSSHSSQGTSSGNTSSGQAQTGTSASHSLTPQTAAPVKTGDLTQTYPFIISLGMSGFLCVVLFRTMLEKKRNVSRAGYREELEKFRKDCEIK